MPVGIDFGTTNSALAIARRDGDVALTSFQSAGRRISYYRSALYVRNDEERGEAILSGPQAMEAFHENAGDGRLIKSLKNFLTDQSFTSTQIGSRRMALEDMIAHIVSGLRVRAEEQFFGLTGPIVVGRPVRFANQSCAEDEAYALSRLRQAFVGAGLKDIVFEYEPIAAAYSYEQRIGKNETILVGDFGGGTSDFCVVRVGPDAKRLTSLQRVLATGGVGLAGDAFDGRIVYHAVCPLLGMEQDFVSPRGRRFEVPKWIYLRLADLSRYPTLRSVENRRVMRSILLDSPESDVLRQLNVLVQENLGYQLFDRISGCKAELSERSSGTFEFGFEDMRLSAHVQRRHFETWIADQLATLGDCVDQTLASASIQPAAIDRVFLTGGTAFVPAIRGLFAAKFGFEKLAGGDEFTSVASGLALKALELAA